MRLRPVTPSERYARYKAFLDDLADLRHLAVYPVTWTGDPGQLIHRVPLTGTQAQGFACIGCGGTSGAMGLLGVVHDTPGCCQIFAHHDCATPANQAPMGSRSLHSHDAGTGTATPSAPVPAPPTPRKDIGTMHATHPSPADARVLLDVDQVLDHAADYLDAHGWCREIYLDIAKPDEQGYPPACVAGALATTVYGPLSAVDLLGLGDLDRPLDEPTEQALLVRSATWWLARHLDPDALAIGESAARIVTDWNDHPRRSKTSVTAALRSAAAAYRDQEAS